MSGYNNMPPPAAMPKSGTATQRFGRGTPGRRRAGGPGWRGPPAGTALTAQPEARGQEPARPAGRSPLIGPKPLMQGRGRGRDMPADAMARAGAACRAWAASVRRPESHGARALFLRRRGSAGRGSRPEVRGGGTGRRAPSLPWRRSLPRRPAVSAAGRCRVVPSTDSLSPLSPLSSRPCHPCRVLPVLPVVPSLSPLSSRPSRPCRAEWAERGPEAT